MASLAAVHGLDVPEKVVACLGFGVDAFHGVNHTQVLENLAALEREGGYLGAFSLSRATGPGSLYLDAVAHAREETPAHPSIVHGSIAAAVRGEFGDVRFTDRTRGSELFINPLMSIHFAVDLDALARRSLYLDRIEDTVLMRQIAAVIEAFREEVTPRPPRRSRTSAGMLGLLMGNAGTGVRAMVIAMSLTGRERRILAEIELALEREDPELAQRVAAINKIESDGNAFPHACGDRLRMWALAHVWMIFSVGGLLIVLLLLAVLTT
ncbi:DUF3040 domain-containing protein [Nonomuraea sp. B12E4]|uniref:DUF3040 domain-containing protein n=1 Tax=Nonomuraea sp. B12E4 TaxID=3153564 RepID=UPI00325EB2DD